MRVVAISKDRLTRRDSYLIVGAGVRKSLPKSANHKADER